jgi:hypothetical protein
VITLHMVHAAFIRLVSKRKRVLGNMYRNKLTLRPIRVK